MCYLIEYLECGVWTLLDTAETLEEAIDTLRGYVNQPCEPTSKLRDDRYQIVTPNNEVL